MPEESAAIPAPREPDLMQYMARGLVVDLRMADDHVAEFHSQDITVANRAQFIDQPPKVSSHTGGPRWVEQRLERLEVGPHSTARDSGLVDPLWIRPEPGSGQLEQEPGH